VLEVGEGRQMGFKKSAGVGGGGKSVVFEFESMVILGGNDWTCVFFFS
jgi:hypothetical protein